MPARLDLHILIVLCADLTKLESGAHFTVQLILLLQEGRRERRQVSFIQDLLNILCNLHLCLVYVHLLQWAGFPEAQR